MGSALSCFLILDTNTMLTSGLNYKLTMSMNPFIVLCRSSICTLNIVIVHMLFLKSVGALELIHDLKSGDKLQVLKGLKFERMYIVKKERVGVLP
jgi:hypothetical protein